MDQVVSLDYYYWAITIMKPSKLQIVRLTSSYYVKLKFSTDVIHVPDACKDYTNTFFLLAKNSLSKEIGSRKLENQPSNFDLDYLVRDINIPPLTKNELENLATNIPWMAEVTVHTLSNKLQEINRNYPYTMPAWLKIMLITSTIMLLLL